MQFLRSRSPGRAATDFGIVPAVPTKKLVSVATLVSLPQGKPKLVRHEKRRLACVRVGSRVHVLEDACPHEGHPLSMGLVRDGRLVCPWHNWTFELETGACTFGGESARRLVSEVHDGEVFVGEPDGGDRARIAHDLDRALADGRTDGVAREALRLAAFGEDVAFEALLDASLEGARLGFGEESASVGAARSLAREGIVSLAEAFTLVGESIVRRGLGRSASPPVVPVAPDRDALLEALLEGRSSDAEALALADGRPFADVAVSTFVPFLALKLFDGGLALSRVVWAEALARDFPSCAPRLRVQVARMLAHSVARSDLPTWRSTRSGVAEALRPRASRRRGRDEGLRDALLASERRAVFAMLDAVEPLVRAPRPGDAADGEGGALAGLVGEVKAGALARVARYDVSWTTRVGSTVTVDEPLRALHLASALEALTFAGPKLLAPLLVQAAGLVGRLSRVSSAAPRDSAEGERRGLLRSVALSSALSMESPARALLAAAELSRVDEARLRPAVAAVLAEPKDRRLERIAANAERVVRTRRPHEGID
jgi:nitrite reductase/ring-hydroxylating ferredoxin subunit